MNKNKAGLIIGGLFAVVAIVLAILFFSQKKELNTIVNTLNDETFLDKNISFNKENII